MPTTIVSSKCPEKTCRCVVRHRLTPEQRRQLIKSLGFVLECPSCRNRISIRLHDDGGFQSTLVVPVNHAANRCELENIGIPDIAGELPFTATVFPSPAAQALAESAPVAALPPFDPIAIDQENNAQLGRISKGLESFSSSPQWIQIAAIFAILSVALVVIWPSTPAKREGTNLTQQSTAESAELLSSDSSTIVLQGEFMSNNQPLDKENE